MKRQDGEFGEEFESGDQDYSNELKLLQSSSNFDPRLIERLRDIEHEDMLTDKDLIYPKEEAEEDDENDFFVKNEIKQATAFSRSQMKGSKTSEDQFEKRKEEELISHQLGDTNLIDQCIEMVQKELEEVYNAKVQQTEDKYLGTIGNLKAQIEDLESKVASLELNDKAILVEEQLRKEYEEKYKLMEQEFIEKFKQETQDLVMKIEAEMEDVLSARGISPERRQQLEEEVKSEIRESLYTSRQSQPSMLQKVPLQPGPPIKIVYQSAPKDGIASKDELNAREKQLSEELEKLYKEQGQVSRLKSLWHVRVKKAGEVLQSLNREKEEFMAEKERYYRDRTSRDSKKLPQSLSKTMIKPALCSRCCELSEEALKKASEHQMNVKIKNDELEGAFLKLLEPNQAKEERGEEDDSHHGCSQNIEETREQRPTGQFLQIIDQPASFGDEGGAKNIEEVLKPIDDINDFIQKRIWNQREEVQKKIEMIKRQDEDLDIEIKKVSTTRLFDSNRETNLRLATNAHDDKSIPTKSEFDYSYHPLSLEDLDDKRFVYETKKLDPQNLFKVSSPQTTPLGSCEPVRFSKTEKGKVIANIFKNQQNEETQGIQDGEKIKDESKIVNTTSKEDSKIRSQSSLNKQIIKTEPSQESKTKPSLQYLMKANEALGLGKIHENIPKNSGDHSLGKDTRSMLNFVFFGNQRFAEDSRTAAHLELYREISNRRRVPVDRLAARIMRESRRGTRELEGLAEAWRDCLGDECEIERILDIIENLSPQEATERVLIEKKYWLKFKEKHQDHIKNLKRRETVRSQISAISLEFKKINDIEMFNKATAGCYNVLRSINKTLLKCPKEVTYKGVKTDILIKLDLFEEEYLHKAQQKLAVQNKFLN